LTIVVDATVVVNACLADAGFRVFRRERLIAPPLLWPEVRSALHQSAYRGDIDAPLALLALRRLHDSEIKPTSPSSLGAEAWRLADDFGWAKTYDAEYVALARLSRCRLVTADRALVRATQRLGFVIEPHQL
jgi:predicted nucleic acid-binding protein